RADAGPARRSRRGRRRGHLRHLREQPVPPAGTVATPSARQCPAQRPQPGFLAAGRRAALDLLGAAEVNAPTALAVIGGDDVYEDLFTASRALAGLAVEAGLATRISIGTERLAQLGSMM